MATDIQITGATTVSKIGDGFRAVPAAASGTSQVHTPAPPTELPTSTELPTHLAKALDEIAAHVAEAGAAVDFQIDEDSGRVIVRVIDRNDGTVLRQMPSEEALRIAHALSKSTGHLIEGRA